MAKLSILAMLGPRVPVVASIAAHVALVAVTTGGGNGKGPPRPYVEAQLIELEQTPVPPPLPEPPPAPAPEPEPPHHHETFENHTHTHAYPVSADHDAHPHDPSIDHRLEAAAAAPEVVAAPDTGIRTFTLPMRIGNVAAGGLTAGDAVSTSGPGRGTSLQAPPPGGEVDESYVSVPARLASSVRPEYPGAARSAGREADVGLEIVVDTSGRVVDARLRKPAGHGFDESALAAIRGYRFTPAQREGAAVRVRMRWVVAFRLE